MHVLHIVISVSIHCLHFTSDSSETVPFDVTHDIFVANQIGLFVMLISSTFLLRVML